MVLRDAEALDESGYLWHLEHHLEDAGGHDVDQRQGNEHLPSELLQLVLPQTGIGEPDPEDQEGNEQDLDQHDAGPEHVQEYLICSTYGASGRLYL